LNSSGNINILAVSRLIKGTIYREKTEIINSWGVRRPNSPPKWRPWLKILYAGCLGLSPAISSQFTVKMCTAAKNC